VGPPETIETGIAGASLFALERVGDERGWFLETFRRSWLGDRLDPIQGNVSRSRAGVLRGLHWHARQSDYWAVVSGTAYVALVDLRSGSPSRFATFERRIDEADGLGLAIPPGVAHGYLAETDVLLSYLVDRYYTGEDEFGLAWDDPGVAVAWPSASPVLSERDRSNPDLSTASAAAPAFA
jgi:dTDP-4-dehydrorhamnose 3,5-epimerase